MAIEHGYATLPDLKARLDILDTKAEAILEGVIEAASRQIDGWCGRAFYAVTETRTFTAEHSTVLHLDDDLMSLTSIVTDDGNRTSGTAWSELDYELEPWNPPHTSIHTSPGGAHPFPTGRRGVRIAGTWGYSATAPHAIREACLILAARLWKRKDAPFGIAGSADHGQIQTLPGMDPDVKQLIQPYRKFAIVGV